VLKIGIFFGEIDFRDEFFIFFQMCDSSGV